ncbi:MAG TPA: hypothetical protein VFU02_15245 [Polyangiaceae bacterium]|nr:hypothetical protein [Polyangiaceae bacterium]
MLVKVASFASCLLCVSAAHAQFAVEPPRSDPPPSDQHPWIDEPYRPAPVHDSVVRAHIGPALRVDRDGATGGLATALDFGRFSGVRVAAAWTALGASAMHAQYGGDLWLSLDIHPELRPVLGAGAAYVRAEASEADTPSEVAPEATEFGVATARVGLEYLFALSTADARLSVEALGALPAIEAEDRAPWLTLSANLALGF